jgi:hypothetical protein
MKLQKPKKRRRRTPGGRSASRRRPAAAEDAARDILFHLGVIEEELEMVRRMAEMCMDPLIHVENRKN